jgi:hypothetical protein
LRGSEARVQCYDFKNIFEKIGNNFYVFDLNIHRKLSNYAEEKFEESCPFSPKIGQSNQK